MRVSKPGEATSFLREVAALSEIKHPNVMPFYGGEPPVPSLLPAPPPPLSPPAPLCPASPLPTLLYPCTGEPNCPRATCTRTSETARTAHVLDPSSPWIRCHAAHQCQS